MVENDPSRHFGPIVCCAAQCGRPLGEIQCRSGARSMAGMHPLKTGVEL